MQSFIVVLANLVSFAICALAALLTAMTLARVRKMEQDELATAPAEFWVRVAAYLADYMVIAVFFTLWIVLLALCETWGWVDGRIWLLGLFGLFSVPLTYFTVPYFLGKQTWGKRVAGLVVERANGDLCGGWRALARGILPGLLWVFPLSLVVLVDGLVLAFTPQKQALHDRLVGSKVRQVSLPWKYLALGPLLFPVMSLMLWVLIRDEFLQTYVMRAPPTFQMNDRVVVNELCYHLAPVRRGDLVVFQTPLVQMPEPVTPGALQVMRVVGLPGETVEIRRGNGIFINDKRLRDPFSIPSYNWPVTAYHYALPPYRLADGEYFVLDDNRNCSLDSHVWFDPSGEPAPGVPKKNILGKVTLVSWPLSHIQPLKSPY